MGGDYGGITPNRLSFRESGICIGVWEGGGLDEELWDRAKEVI